MLSKFKFYTALILALITAQIVMAGERVVDFQRALNSFQKEREPSQTKSEFNRKKIENPAMEISFQKEVKKEQKIEKEAKEE